MCDGPNATKKGTILHLYRDIVFLHNKQMTDTLGVFIEKARSVELVGYEMMRQGDANSYGAMKKKEEMMGKMIQIVRGEYKGQHGLVKNVTETEVRVLLSSKS